MGTRYGSKILIDSAFEVGMVSDFWRTPLGLRLVYVGLGSMTVGVGALVGYYFWADKPGLTFSSAFVVLEAASQIGLVVIYVWMVLHPRPEKPAASGPPHP